MSGLLGRAQGPTEYTAARIHSLWNRRAGISQFETHCNVVKDWPAGKAFPYPRPSSCAHSGRSGATLSMGGPAVKMNLPLLSTLPSRFVCVSHMDIHIVHAVRHIRHIPVRHTNRSTPSGTFCCPLLRLPSKDTNFLTVMAPDE